MVGAERFERMAGEFLFGGVQACDGVEVNAAVKARYSSY